MADKASAMAEKMEMELRVKELEDQLKKQDADSKTRETEMKDVKEKAKEKLTTASNAIKKLKTEYANLRGAYQKLKGEGTEGNNELLKTIRSGIAVRKRTTGEMKKNITSSRSILNGVKKELDSFNAYIPTLTPQILQGVNAFVTAQTAASASLMISYRKEMALRKQYFNQIQELKG